MKSAVIGGGEFRIILQILKRCVGCRRALAADAETPAPLACYQTAM